MKMLVCAAHPDDEILGMGGTISKLVSEGHEVNVCVFTTSYSPFWDDKYREDVTEEQKRIDAYLSITKRFNLGFPTCKLISADQMDLFQSFKKVVDAVKPDRFYCPSFEDFHRDHQEVFRACLVASRPVGGQRPSFLTYETPSSTEWGYDSFKPHLHVDISRHLGWKIGALACYKREGKVGDHPRSLESVERLARLRGEQIGVHAAEAFQVVRHYE